MPIIAKGVTESIFEIGLLVASFSFAQILSEIYFGRHSDKKGNQAQIHQNWLYWMCHCVWITLFCR